MLDERWGGRYLGRSRGVDFFLVGGFFLGKGEGTIPACA